MNLCKPAIINSKIFTFRCNTIVLYQIIIYQFRAEGNKSEIRRFLFERIIDTRRIGIFFVEYNCTATQGEYLYMPNCWCKHINGGTLKGKPSLQSNSLVVTCRERDCDGAAIVLSWRFQVLAWPYDIIHSMLVPVTCPEVYPSNFLLLGVP